MVVVYKDKKYIVTIARGDIYLNSNPIEHYPRPLRDKVERLLSEGDDK